MKFRIGSGNCTFFTVLSNLRLQDATTSEVKRAYRKLSLVHHPDRNKDADAPEKFRQVQYSPFSIVTNLNLQIAAVYEVLKDEKMRKT